MALRVYHMVYNKYLAGFRREKNSCERPIKERGVSGFKLAVEDPCPSDDAISVNAHYFG